MKARPVFGNLLAGLPRRLREEKFTDVLEGRAFRVERIVSTGQATPDGEWYDQAAAEWVVVLQGAARIVFEGEETPRALGPGDHVLIPPHVRHRVAWTDPDETTVWLAIHYDAKA